MAMSLSQKLELAQQICKENDTQLAVDNAGEVLIVERNNTINKTKVRKLCLSNVNHPVMDVTLGSIVASERGGCAKCARIKGGKKSKRT